MRLQEVQHLLEAEVLCGQEKLALEVETAFSSDLMSDVLAFVDEYTLLITGLVNEHVIRTAEMVDIQAVVFVRGKEVPQEVVAMAEERHMILLRTKKTLYETSGILYNQGLPSLAIRS